MLWPLSVQRPEAEVLAGHLAVEAAVGGQRGISGHGPGIIAAAFKFVPGIAPGSVIAVPHRADDGQAFLFKSVHDHVDAGLVFKAVHGFLAVGHRNNRPVRAFRPGADLRTGFVIEAVDPAGVENMTETAVIIVLIDGAQRGTDALPVKQVIQSDQIAVPLGEYLID